MAKANYVGRVGALAVALGIGTAVFASPGVVWAQPSDDASSSDSAGSSADPADADDSPQSEGAESGESDDESDDDESGDRDDQSGDAESGDSDDESAEGDDESGDDDTSEPKRRSSYGSRQHDAAPDRADRSVDAGPEVDGGEAETVDDADPAEAPSSTRVDDEPGAV
ncbi:MAG: hypothetical protein U1D00_14485, partial [Mycobacterium sp.]|nr:hypothetical protein [Mycobacterium sp.]